MLSDAWRGNNRSFTYYMMGSGLAIKFLGGRSKLMAEFPEHSSSEVKRTSSIVTIKSRIERKTKIMVLYKVAACILKTLCGSGPFISKRTWHNLEKFQRMARAWWGVGSMMVGNNTELHGKGDRAQLSTVCFTARTYGPGSKDRNVIFMWGLIIP